MKNTLISFSIMLCFGTALGQNHQADSWQVVKANKKGTLTVVYFEQTGLIEKGTDGKMTGMCVDILASFASYVKDKYGVNLSINYAVEKNDFAEYLQTVQNSQNVLGVANTSVTAARERVMKFTTPYLMGFMVFLSHKDAPTLSSLNEISTKFSGYTAWVINGSTHMTYMNQLKRDYFPNLVIKTVDAGPTILDEMGKNNKILTLLDFTEYIYAIRKRLPVKRQEVEVGQREKLAFAMPLQSDWDAIINEFLTEDYTKSTEYKKIISNNLGSAFLNMIHKQ